MISCVWSKTRRIRKDACTNLNCSRVDGHFYLLYERWDSGPYGHGIAAPEVLELTDVKGCCG